jgi:hypothetical protein
MCHEVDVSNHFILKIIKKHFSHNARSTTERHLHASINPSFHLSRCNGELGRVLPDSALAWWPGSRPRRHAVRKTDALALGSGTPGG